MADTFIAHRWYARDGYEECHACGLLCEVTDTTPIDDQPYPLHCGPESQCPVLGEDGRSQAHHLIGAVGGLECYYCGKHYS
jgi:hypothetical protein